MKVLKIIGILILILIVLIIIVGLIAPKDYSVERTLVINAPKEIVFDHVKYWRNWQAWSPWVERDSLLQSTVEGKDGELGSKYKWIGNPKITGEGELTNTGVKELEEIAYQMHFIKPWESFSEGYVRIVDENGATKVAWGLYGKNPFPWNVIMLFMSMDKMVGNDFSRGLEMLQNICEQEAETITSYDIQEMDFAGMTFAAIRQTVSFADIKTFYEQSFATIATVLGTKKINIAGAPVGLYFSWDEQAAMTDMAAAFPVKKAVTDGDVQTITIPAGTAYALDYYGPYEESMIAYKALDYYFKNNQLEFGVPIMEEYLTDPATEPDNAKRLTRIYYFVKSEE